MKGRIIGIGVGPGDPALYSTFSYIAKLAHKDAVDVECISGVSSITACVDRLGLSLVDGNEQLHVIPRTEDIENALKLPGTRVIMKSGKYMITIIVKDDELGY